MPGARLTEHDRGVIERAMRQGLPVPQIAALVGKHRTTVARELVQGSGSRPDRRPKHPAGSARRGTRGRSAVYHAWVAQARASESARRPKEFKLSGDLGLVVSGLLQANWSPQQISQRLPELYPDQDGMRVSHETIYRSLFVQARGELRRELTKHLRTSGPVARLRAARRPAASWSARSRSVRGRPRPVTVQSRATGKATC